MKGGENVGGGSSEERVRFGIVDGNDGRLVQNCGPDCVRFVSKFEIFGDSSREAVKGQILVVRCGWSVAGEKGAVGSLA